MTYKMNSELQIIESPIIIEFPDGRKTEYDNGKRLLEASFDKKYTAICITAIDSKIAVRVRETEIPAIGFDGETIEF